MYFFFFCFFFGGNPGGGPMPPQALCFFFPRCNFLCGSLYIYVETHVEVVFFGVELAWSGDLFFSVLIALILSFFEVELICF